MSSDVPMTIMQSHHIVSAFDDELKYLTRKIAAMGGHAERMVDQAVHGAGPCRPWRWRRR